MTTSRQTFLFPEIISYIKQPKPVNVSSVPQRSPFRYPGGKTWFVPTFRHWVNTMHQKPDILIEPFAGGGVISLTALFENLVNNVIMAEIDDEISAVWESIINGDAEWLSKKIIGFELSRETAIKEINNPPRSLREKAFKTILKNRTFHGGILAKGSGLLKYGEGGKGIHSRWYPETIAKRIMDLNAIVDKIDFRCEDGIKTIRGYAKRRDVIYFIDPPYTAGGKKAGTRLYKHYNIDHEHLFALCATLQGNFLMTYDNADEVKNMARSYGFHMRLVPMTNTHHVAMEELVIGKDLSWMDEFPSVHEPKAGYGNSK